MTSLTDAEVLIGRNFTFSCSATGNPSPTVSWSRRGRLLPIGSETITVSPEGDKLTLSFIDSTDAGGYTCTAENVVSDQGSLVTKSVSSTAQLIVIGKYVSIYLFVYTLRRVCHFVDLSVSHSCVNVHVQPVERPFFLVPPLAVAATPNVIVVSGRTALLRCNATGIPAPTVTWSRNGERLLSGRYLVQEGTLEISNSEVEDAGQYVCLASNKGGNSTSTVTLFVHCK